MAYVQIYLNGDAGRSSVAGNLDAGGLNDAGRHSGGLLRVGGLGGRGDSGCRNRVARDLLFESVVGPSRHIIQIAHLRSGGLDRDAHGGGLLAGAVARAVLGLAVRAVVGGRKGSGEKSSSNESTHLD